MHRVHQVVIEGVKGFNRTVELGSHTLIAGPNGSGKSAIIAGIHLALTGAVPPDGPKMAWVNAAGETMTAGVSVMGADGNIKDIKRSWKFSGGKTTERVCVNGVSSPGRTAGPLIQSVLGESAVFDTAGFWAMPPKDQRHTLLRMLGGLAPDANPEAAFEEEAKARDHLLDIRHRRRLHEGTIAGIICDMESHTVSDRAEEAMAERKEVQALIQTLTQRITQAESYAKAMTRAEQAAAECSEIEPQIVDLSARRDALEDQIGETRKRLRTAEAQCGLCPASVPLVVQVGALQTTFAALTECATVLNWIGWDDPAGKVSAVIGKLSNLIIPTKIDPALAEALESDERELGMLIGDLVTRERTRDRLVAVMEQAKDIPEAQSTDEDVARLAGARMRLTELDDICNRVSARDALEGTLDSAKAELAKIEASEEKAKARLRSAEIAVADILDTTQETLRDRSSSVLPTGTLVLKMDGTSALIGWSRDGITVHRHALSGGEKVIFDAALAYSLAPQGLLILEAAEVDTWEFPREAQDLARTSLGDLLVHLAKLDAQIILLTCHPFVVRNILTPTPWRIVCTTTTRPNTSKEEV